MTTRPLTVRLAEVDWHLALTRLALTLRPAWTPAAVHHAIATDTRAPAAVIASMIQSALDGQVNSPGASKTYQPRTVTNGAPTQTAIGDLDLGERRPATDAERAAIVAAIRANLPGKPPERTRQ